MEGLFSLRRIWELWKRWLTLGMGVKRWFLVLGLGAIVAGVGFSSLLIALENRSTLPAGVYRALTLQFLPVSLRIGLPLLIGVTVIVAAIMRLGSTLVAPFRRPGEDIAESLYEYSQRGRGPRIVAIGGGTGMPALLRGLSHYSRNITAIVTVADDGGSSGRLRRELGVLPPGDFRNNIAALARDETLMAQLLQYRFGGAPEADGTGEQSQLSGHAFGNLLIAALTGITGSFDEALVAAGDVLAIRGRVLPSTLADVTLVGEVTVGASSRKQRIVGESAIPKAGGRIMRVSLEPADAPAYPPAVRAILEADLVLVGPGSLYTSILPNLLVPDITRALQRTRARRLFICNLATQPGETDNYTVADHVSGVTAHLAGNSGRGSRLFDAVLANDNLSVPQDAGGGNTTFVEAIAPDHVPMVSVDLVDEQRPWRHDSTKLAKAVMQWSASIT